MTIRFWVLCECSLYSSPGRLQSGTRKRRNRGHEENREVCVALKVINGRTNVELCGVGKALSKGMV